MKKFLALAAVIALFSTAANAQASIEVGYLNPSTVKSATEPVDFTSTTKLNGAYVGFDYNFKITKNFGIAPGVFYSWATGKNEDGKIDILKDYGKVTQQYIGIPVNLTFGFNLADDMRISVYAGPTFSYGLKDMADDVDLYENLGELYNKFNISVGGGFAFDFANDFRINLGYSYGITDRYDAPLLDQTWKRHMLHMGVGYIF